MLQDRITVISPHLPLSMRINDTVKASLCHQEVCRQQARLHNPTPHLIQSQGLRQHPPRRRNPLPLLKVFRNLLEKTKMIQRGQDPSFPRINHKIKISNLSKFRHFFSERIHLYLIQKRCFWKITSPLKRRRRSVAWLSRMQRIQIRALLENTTKTEYPLF